ncbi:MAG: glycoside hydrolase family 3 N-terminal domain-containing protein [Chloroflexota bacterium]
MISSKRGQAIVGRNRRAAFLLLLTLLASLLGPAPAARAQTPTPPVYIQNLLADMTPEEKVGQLFLVTFLGTDASETSQIYDLIVNRHVGGVVLQADNDNFVDAPDTVAEAYRLIHDLQQAEWQGAQIVGTDSAGQPSRSVYVPLWVGIVQEGNGAPNDQILSGMTPMPSAMALGATWDPQLSEQAGAVLGRELSAMGFNLYLGPSLDVLEQPGAASADLGNRAFGGDPFWVAEMGQAFVAGLHTGSDSHLFVIAKHFPGRGGSDRLPEEEVATVRKSLEQLKQIELAPFFSVTGGAPNPMTAVDGLLVSHIRYQGFQGNIRATTRPVSFDAQALNAIINLPEIVPWRENGGLVVSDDLGSRAVREFYAPGGGAFNARLIARDAFLAGNDMLYLGDITASDTPNRYETVLQILDFFTQKYREDPAFAQSVDAAVARILAAKYRLYGNFSLSLVTPLEAGLDAIGGSEQVTFEAARNAATLVSPDAAALADLLPGPPAFSDRLIFFTDTAVTRQCSTCLDQPTLAVDALQRAISRLYGPSAGGQVLETNLASFTFNDLNNFLDGTGGEFIEPDLERARWVVLLLTDSSNDQPALIRRFLSERPDLVRNKYVILFAFSAPYYLDSTDISKLTAYYALYGKTSPFVDVAARLLYRELTPEGASPVSVPGIGYDLISVTAPDPQQIIPLFLDLPPAAAPTALSTTTPEPTPIPLFGMGDTVVVRTGKILDHNGNPVPDGTVVRFNIGLSGETGALLRQEESITVGGVARITYRLEQPGLVEIRAQSDPALFSEVLQLDVAQGEVAAVTVIVPVLSETVAATPVTPLPVEEDEFITPKGTPTFGGWFLFLLVLAAGGWLAYWTGARLQSPRWGIRWALCALLGGLLAYNYLAFGLPGSESALTNGGGAALIGFALAGELLGMVCAWVWMRRVNAPVSRSG